MVKYMFFCVFILTVLACKSQSLSNVLGKTDSLTIRDTKWIAPKYRHLYDEFRRMTGQSSINLDSLYEKDLKKIITFIRSKHSSSGYFEILYYSKCNAAISPDFIHPVAEDIVDKLYKKGVNEKIKLVPKGMPIWISDDQHNHLSIDDNKVVVIYHD